MDYTELASVLKFRPPIWWDPPPDPDWFWKRMEAVLDQKTLVELVNVQLVAQQEILRAQMVALEKTAELLAKGMR